MEPETRITDEDFFTVLWKFNKKKSKTYDFITKAGLQFQLAILTLCRRVIYSEVFPSRFDITTLVQLPKRVLPKNWTTKGLYMSKNSFCA